jgi:hypothetical protein
MDKMDETDMSHTLNGIKNLFDKNLDQMKENFNTALSLHALEKLNEMKKGMAKTLFAGKK